MLCSIGTASIEVLLLRITRSSLSTPSGTIGPHFMSNYYMDNLSGAVVRADNLAWPYLQPTRTGSACPVSNTNGVQLPRLSKKLDFEIIASLTPTHYPVTVTSRSFRLDIAHTKSLLMWAVSICFIVSMKITVRSLKNETSRQRLFKTDVKNDIETTNFDAIIGALAKNVKMEVKSRLWMALTSVDRQKLSANDIELLKAKNKALCQAYAYPTVENRSRARALQYRGFA
ncbi:hypothetical protein EVAR_55964_1 [Eumeta japonica]|uniref:Uncharacterized protein n=1 Tax=Eumeta variegata TaxID=151549 RepID=A0A4C1YX48_EUMVA|nr:hypothetical protein EVAR_55964_1 [Eumeta japonica]